MTTVPELETRNKHAGSSCPDPRDKRFTSSPPATGTTPNGRRRSRNHLIPHTIVFPATTMAHRKLDLELLGLFTPPRSRTGVPHSSGRPNAHRNRRGPPVSPVETRGRLGSACSRLSLERSRRRGGLKWGELNGRIEKVGALGLLTKYCNVTEE